MKPLIKWAGGKANEIKHIEQLIPKNYERYFEPFFGGGAVFFDLEPSKAIINDISKELILFYQLLKDEKRRPLFKKELLKYAEYWERIDKYMSHFGNSFLNLYNKYKRDEIDDKQFKERIDVLFEKEIVPFNGLFSSSFCMNKEDLLKNIKRNVISKLKRTKEKVDVGNNFSDDEIKKNIETAFRSGFYTHFREIMNLEKKNLIDLTDEKRVANYYFIREFCYGGMFRFNQYGDFNVPYGGMNYNSKDFRSKLVNLFAPQVNRLLQNTTIENVDFDVLFKKYKPTKNDFVFLDPPYDTDFSTYEENPFTKKDQERLAECVLNLKAKFILIIKETPFILKLYRNQKGIKISSFEKTYSYNIKGRNIREVRHLIIHNLQEKQAQLINLKFLGVNNQQVQVAMPV